MDKGAVAPAVSLKPCLGRPGPAVALLALGLWASGAGCSRGPAAGAQGPGGIAVKIEVARSVSVDETTEYIATLKSRDSAAIMPQVEGPITEILVRSGDRVSAGQPLMQIDPAKQQATVKSLEDARAARRAGLEFAKQQYERVNGLFRAGIASQQELDQTKSALDAVQAEVQSLDAQVREQAVQLHYYRVVAPMGGIVGDIPVRVGDRVTVSTTLTTLDRPGGLEAYVYVPVERAPRLRMGLAVEILDSTDQVLADSHLGFISPQVDNQTQTVLVKAGIDNPKGSLRTSQFIRARIVWGTHEGPVVPVLAVSRISGQYFAFVAEGKEGALVARQRPLKVGEMTGKGYLVREGIKPGERVIVSGTQFLVDGAPVTPQG